MALERVRSGGLGPLAQSGIAGLDDVLYGGFTRKRVSLIEGAPGTGKTTLALQFLLTGTRAGESGLYITLSETAEELRASAESHGWSLDGIEIFELVPPEASFDPARQQSVLHASEMELGETTQTILEVLDRVQPTRVVFDSLSEIRLLAQSSLRYRRQVLALKHHFASRDCTVLLLDDLTSSVEDLHLHSIAHGVITLEQVKLDYGAERRRLRVLKLRGTRFRPGFHDFTIVRGGLNVFPRLVAAEHKTEFVDQPAKSGLPGLDTLLGGGLDRGTSTLLIGPAGCGKSSMMLQFVYAGLKRGEKAAIFCFDENTHILLKRARGLGMNIDPFIAAGTLQVRQVDPAELSPGEFTHMVRRSVDVDGARILVVDSLNGYLAAMPEERYLVLQMHELLSYLNHRGVVTLMVLAQHGLVGQMQSPIDLTYLSDTVILLRYFEADARVRKAVSVIKKRSGAHEDTIREYELGPAGVTVGETLRAFRGLLTGVPMPNPSGDARR